MTGTYADLASAYLEAGWSPIPIIGTDKAAVPRGFTGYRGRYVTVADVARLAKRYGDRNLAIRCPRDVMFLDVDNYEGKPGAATLAELEAALCPLPPGPLVTARDLPSGKRGFRVPNGSRFRGTAGPGIDVVSWHVRYVAAAGTHHTGAAIRWLDSESGEELDRIPEPGDLPDLPWEWLEYLSASGSQYVADDATPEAVAEWLEEHTDEHRPGWIGQIVRDLEARLENGRGRHPETLPALCQVVREATAGAYAASKAVARIREVWDRHTAGENRGEEFETNLLTFAVGQLAAEDGPARVDEVRDRMSLPPLSAPPAEEDPDAWPELDPLDRHALPALPADALPRWAGEFTTAAADALQVPPDLVGVLVLGAIAATTTGRVQVRVKPDYAEPLNLWAAVVADPGERKSPAVSAATGPVRAAEAELAAATEDERSRLGQERRILDRRAERLEKDAAHADPSGLAEALTAAREAREAAEEVQVPPEPRFLAGDATPEAVVQVAAAQGGRIALVSDEVGPLADMGRRYSSGGAANLDAFLTGWSGGPYRVDRTGRTGEHLESLNLSVVVAAQPAAVADLFTPENRGRGVVGRVLWSWPGTLLGRRDPDPPSVPEPVAAAYAAQLGALAEELHRLEEAAEVKLTAAAERLRVEFAREVEPRLAPAGGDLAELDGWASKLTGNVVRLAGLLHVAEHGPRGEVSAETMTAATELGRYFTAHALKVWGDTDHLEALAGARKVRAWLRRQGDPGEFTLRDVHRGAFQNGRTAAAEEVRSYLRVLATRGYARELPKTPGLGQQPERWELRPDLAADEAAGEVSVRVVRGFAGNPEPADGPHEEDL